MKTPICDLIERLVSTGMSPGDALAAARPVEAAVPRSSVSGEGRREKWRLKKARQRAKAGGHVPGTSPLDIDSPSLPKTQSRLKKVIKKDSGCPLMSPGDDWPEDYRTAFWDAYPPGRKYDKAKVYALLERLRYEGFVNAEKKRERLTWATLTAGLARYVATNPGSFAKAPEPWLRGHRWQGDYGTNGGGSNESPWDDRQQNLGFSGLAATIRAARQNR